MDFGKSNKTPEFLAKFPFGKVPAMETPDGPIFESNAIAYYIALHKPELVGNTPYEKALVQQFICSLECELTPVCVKVFYPVLGYMAYEPTEWKKAVEELLVKLKVYDTILQPKTYLVGETITLADILFSRLLCRVFDMILEPKDRKNFVNLTRWYVTIANQPNFRDIVGEMKLCEKRVDPAKAAASKPQLKPVAAAAAHDDEEEEEAPKPKAKNALDLLPPSKLNLEEWKRFYSNCKETRPVATNWFWEHFDSEGYSIWRANYRYNDELKKIFMTCNLVTGLFARMEALRKYCFASVLIFGEDDNNEISGFFVFRGKDDIPDLMKEVPDFDSYEWTRMDINDKKQVELFNDYLAWEGDLEGKSFNQGKIFK